MIKWLVSLFKSESAEERATRLESQIEEKRIQIQGEIEEINGKITRAQKGIALNVNIESLEHKRFSLLQTLNELPPPRSSP